jgi:gliding motility-associated-like protein
MKKQIILYLLFCFSISQAQTITPQVINSAGSDRQLGNTGVYITDNVGEPFTQAIGANGLLITQGFIQPSVISPGGFRMDSQFQSPACLETSDDAFISVTINTTIKNYSVTYLWTPSSVCPGNNCSKITKLKPGKYSIKVALTYTNNLGLTLKDTLKTQDFDIVAPKVACNITVYNAVTPNNDGVNDVWTIDNITDYPTNKVTIYNRWGLQVAEIKGYNNTSKFWPGKEQLDFLNATTYFYVIELESGGTPIKGWVELVKSQ